MFLNSACEENTKGKLVIPLACIGNDLDEFRHQLFIITLIKSINQDDHSCRWFEVRICHRQHRFNQQLLELVSKRSSCSIRVIMNDALYEWFGGGDRNGKLIRECRNEVCNSASFSCAS